MMWRYGYPGITNGWVWGWGIVGLVANLLFWGAAIWLVVTLVRNIRRPGESGEDSAMKILRERYARGEINKKEFEDLKKDLS
jgi:putative membrane protein